MCGIVGILGGEDVAERLLDGLRRLEYRGYDSAGIATIDHGSIERRRASGKLINLARELAAHPLPGTIGIAHTRWATHGGPTTNNAHPHATDHVAVVHNGIIENFKALREELTARGRVFTSETDTEVVAHLVSEKVEQGLDPVAAVREVLPRLHGAFALAILFRDQPDLLIGARLGSPLVVGYGDDETYLGSDALALAPLTQRIAYLDEGDWVVCTREGAQVYDRDNNPVERPVTISGVTGALIDKGNHRHFMQKEIYEQPIVVAQTLRSYLQRLEGKIALPIPDFDLSGIKRVTIVACGTSFYAGMVAKYWFEQFARVPVDIDVASEFRYRTPVMEPGGLMIVISQSGATPCQERGADDRGGGQRPHQFDGARSRPAAAHPCRAGDRRRLDQGLYLPVERARRAGRQSRQGQGPPDGGRRKADRPPPRRGARRDQRRAGL